MKSTTLSRARPNRHGLSVVALLVLAASLTLTAGPLPFEPPNIAPAEPGLWTRSPMVFACDAFAIYPEENLGVRVENTDLITETGCENLTPGIPREIAEIEKLMSGAAKAP